VLAFVVIGRASHHAGETLAGVASTSWPFLAGLAAGAQGSLDKVRELLNADPGVRQCLYCFEVMTWRTPAGRIGFTGPPQGLADHPAD